jgi:alcohol dehydrogenase (cytochrome c)
MSTAADPALGLFFVMALEKCSVYYSAEGTWKPGQSFYNGGARRTRDETPHKYLRALALSTGRIAWEVPQVGTADSWGGVLSTAGGLVFFGDDAGAFAAVDSRTGKPLWHFHTNTKIGASPMAYLAGGAQFVAIAAGNAIIAFGLPPLYRLPPP